MKVGNITQTNQKGQIVIPKNIRIELGIDENVFLNMIVRGGGIYIYPIEETVTNIEKESSYLDILQKTKGTWAGDDWEETSKKRRRIELKASRERKKAW